MPPPTTPPGSYESFADIIRRQAFLGLPEALGMAAGGQARSMLPGGPRPPMSFLGPLVPGADGLVNLRGGSTPPPTFMDQMPTTDGLVTLTGGSKEPPGLVDDGQGRLVTNPMWKAFRQSKANQQEAEDQDAQEDALATQRRVAAIGEQEQARKTADDEAWAQFSAANRQRGAEGLARIGQGGRPKVTRKPSRG